jgi:hypothetical protein
LEKPSYTVAVVMQRRRAQSPWADVIWEPHGVVPAYAGSERKLLVEHEDVAQWLHPGFKLELHRDEAEGSYLNAVGIEPRVFVLWRMEGDDALPVQVTVSAEEASRWLDGGHAVDGVSMPPEIYAWVGEYVENNYRPQPQKRIKPRSFQHPKDRV